MVVTSKLTIYSLSELRLLHFLEEVLSYLPFLIEETILLMRNFFLRNRYTTKDKQIYMKAFLAKLLVIMNYKNQFKWLSVKRN